MMLETFFHENSRVALAFSGGVDSAYLLYAARAWRRPGSGLLRPDRFSARF